MTHIPGREPQYAFVLGHRHDVLQNVSTVHQLYLTRSTCAIIPLCAAYFLVIESFAGSVGQQ